MGKSPFQLSQVLMDKAKVVTQVSVTATPSFDNYFLFHEEGFFVGTGKILWKLPAGDYELEAHAFLYNQNTTRKYFSTSLLFYLGSQQKHIAEGGQIAPTDPGRPMQLHFKVLTTFSKSQTIEWVIGSDAQNLQVMRPQITARRIGSIKFKTIG